MWLRTQNRQTGRRRFLAAEFRPNSFAAIFLAALALFCADRPAFAATTVIMTLSVVPAATTAATCTPVAIKGALFAEALTFVCAERPALAATAATASHP